MRIENVKINGIKDPIGYMYDYISCSWSVVETTSNKPENIIIEVSNDNLFENILIRKEGRNLKQSGEKLDIDLLPRTVYYYRITVIGDKGDTTTSDIHYFETGKMNEKWSAKWISPQQGEDIHPIISNSFSISNSIKMARLYITGVGLFEAYLNGKKIGNEYLMPYVTNYETNIQVITLPVEKYINESDNTIEILLGKGWYMSQFGLELKENNYGNRMATIAELHIEYVDGSNEVIVTDSSWKYKASNIEDSGIYLGEIVDRNLWERKENNHKFVEVLNNPESEKGTENLNISKFIDRISLPVLAKEALKPKEIITTPKGEMVIDFGQNFAGIVQFKVNLPKGTKITLDFGEILQEGNFYNGNYRDAKSQYVYISNGIEEVVEPHFTFFGFRYVRVSGWVGSLNKENFVGKALYSDIERIGYVETSHEKLNKLYENTLWGLKSNFLDIPTDCPQRSERLGWTGDIQVFAATACYHMDNRAFLHKFIKDLRDEQIYLNGAIPNYIPNISHKKESGSVWGDVATFLPEKLYSFYGNLDEITYSYDLMKEWVDYIDKRDINRNFLFDTTMGHTFGDWLALDGATPTSFKGSTDDTFISSVYYYRSTQIVKEMSALIGMSEEFKYYEELEENIKNAILHEYFSVSGRLTIDTQAGLTIALKFGIYIDREKLITQFKTRLKKDMYEIKCGFVGAPLLCTVLAEVGLYELAYDFLLKEDYPSWLHAVNLGATTVWERWNSVSKEGVISSDGMNSLNHYAYGSVMEFVYAYLVGIKPIEPGFKRVSIAPKPDIRIREVKSKYKSVNGTYQINWKIESDGTLDIDVVVPFNCTAEVELPGNAEGIRILESGEYNFKYRPLIDYRSPYSESTRISRLLSDQNATEILKKYAPILIHIVSNNKEMSSNSLRQISYMHFLPFDPVELEKAITEITDLVIE